MTAIALIVGPFFIGNARTATRLAENEMYPLGYMLEPTNTEYDVSPYRIPGEYVFYSNDLSVSENEFEAYAESKLQTIDNKTELSIRGTFQDYNFLIVRSDMREKWLEENSYSGFQYYDGYASISYGRQGREWMIIPETLAVYIDPSDKFIIITNCNDYKIIAEFFEGRLKQRLKRLQKHKHPTRLSFMMNTNQSFTSEKTLMRICPCST